MIPFPKDLTIKRGDTKEVFFRVRERVFNEVTNTWVAGDYRDLTGWSVKSQIRETEDAAEPIAEFAASLADQAVTPGGVLLKLTPVQTAAVVVLKGVWDCQLTDPANDVWTYIEGKVTFSKDVTR